MAKERGGQAAGLGSLLGLGIARDSSGNDGCWPKLPDGSGRGCWPDPDDLRKDEPSPAEVIRKLARRR
jgi:hypothetical protein